MREVDPIAELLTALERDGRVPLAWALRVAGDGAEPVRAAWRRSDDVAAMVRFAARVGAAGAVCDALEHADAWLPVLLGTTARGERVTVCRELCAAAVLLAAGAVDAAASRVARAEARWPIAQRAVRAAVRAALPEPPPLGALLSRAGRAR